MTARAVLLCGIILAAAPPLEARTWVVGGPGADFPLIAPALAAAADGDVVIVRPGIYREDLVLDRRVSLVGEQWPRLIGTGAGTVITVRHDGCEVRGLAIEGSGTGIGNRMDAAVHLMSSGNRVVGNRMRRVFYGVVVIGAPGNEIAGNDIVGLEDLPFGQRGDGIYAYRAPDTSVRHNRVAGMRDGIYFQYAPRGVAEDNVVERSRYGLHDMFSDAARIERNVFRDCSAGANVMNSTAVTLRRNRFERNRGVSAVGLSFKQCDRSLVAGNVFAGNVRGLLLDGSSENRFDGNRFVGNDTAAYLLASAERNLFAGNAFDANWSDVVVSGRDAGTRWSEDGRGNRWSRYRGFDFDGDGVGEAPHPMVGPFERIEARQPAVRLLLHSPAAAALELASSLRASTGALLDDAPLAGPPPVDSTGAARRAPGLPAVVVLAFAAALAVREVRTCSR